MGKGPEVPASEPTPAALTNPFLRYFLATRPAFLSVSLVACLLGLAAAMYDRVFVSSWPAVLTIVSALVAHAGINVLNDYYDALNGTDDINTDRISPLPAAAASFKTACLAGGRPPPTGSPSSLWRRWRAWASCFAPVRACC